MPFIIVISMLMVNLIWVFNMWNFEDKVKTNDIEEICNLLKAYKGQWVAMVDKSGGAVEYDGNTCEDYSWCLKVENAEPISDRQFNFYGKFFLIENGMENIFSLEHSGTGDRLIPLCLDNWVDTDETTIYPIDKKEILKFVEGQL